MKVSIIHPERRCAQHLTLDIVTPLPPAGFPEKLMPTQRFDFALAPGSLLAFVASAAIKAPPGTQFGDFSGLLGPLVIELEAEEGERLPDDLVQVWRLDTAAAAFIRSHAGSQLGSVFQRDIDRTIDALVKLKAPITLAGDRQQYGMVNILVHPERDLLIAFAAPDCAGPQFRRPPGCICREFIGDMLKVEPNCPAHADAYSWT